LGENKVVYLESCDRIQSFAALKNVPKVDIALCAGFSNGFDVENVLYLKISYCRNFIDVTMLGKVDHLQLLGTWGESFEGLQDVSS
jgi:hypothetical protein